MTDGYKINKVKWGERKVEAGLIFGEWSYGDKEIEHDVPLMLFKDFVAKKKEILFDNLRVW